MFLAKSQIRVRFYAGLFEGSSGDGDCIQQASYDLRLGATSYVVGTDVPVTLQAGKQEYITIAPG